MKESRDPPPGPNPHRNDPMLVAPFGKVWAVVECLGVISTHKTRQEADAALAAELERRRAQRSQLGLNGGGTAS
jgi:hypothetical protein